VTFRDLAPDEFQLVLDSWSKSYRSSDWAGTVPNHMWHAVVRETIAGLIGRGAKILAAACGDSVWGWVCYERKGDDVVLHYVYVKDPFREGGLGFALTGALFPDAKRVFYTHRTRLGQRIIKKIPGASYVPEIARRKAL
jgi:hypothetical protein